MTRYAIYRRPTPRSYWALVTTMSTLPGATEAAYAITATGYGQTIVTPESILPAGRIRRER